MMKTTGIALLCVWLFSASAFAETVEIFLLKTQENTIENLELARELGHTITFYYLDAQQAIEKKLTQEVDVSLSRIFQSVIAELSNAEKSALGDEGITEKVMKRIATDSEFQQQADVMKSVSNDPDIKAALIRASEDKQHAKTRGVVMEDLPTIVFKQTKFNNVTDFKKVSQAVVSQ